MPQVLQAFVIPITVSAKNFFIASVLANAWNALLVQMALGSFEFRDGAGARWIARPRKP